MRALSTNTHNTMFVAILACLTVAGSISTFAGPTDQVADAPPLSPATVAGTDDPSRAPSPDRSRNCGNDWLFTAGKSSSNTYIQYCVTDNGNISYLYTVNQLNSIGAYGEGYGVCQETPAVDYHDYHADASPNWGTAQILSVTGSAIKISRSTADGNWTLVQTISKVTSTGSIKVVMALTNNQSVDKVVYLLRFAHVNKMNAVAGGSRHSAFIWGTASDFKDGVVLQNMGKWEGYRQGFVQDPKLPVNPCAFAYNALPYGFSERGHAASMHYAYVSLVPAHQTITVTLNYRGT